jgi:hypothetical protein
MEDYCDHCNGHSGFIKHGVERFKVTAKSCNVATRTEGPRQVKTAQNSQRSKTSNFVLATKSRAEGGM